MPVPLVVGVLGRGRASARAAWVTAASRAGFAASLSAVAKPGDGGLGRTALVLSTIYERPRLPFARLGESSSLSVFQDRPFGRAFSATAATMVRAVLAGLLAGDERVAVLRGPELWWLCFVLLTCSRWSQTTATRTESDAFGEIQVRLLSRCRLMA
jgi:hypothetical protein